MMKQSLIAALALAAALAAPSWAEAAPYRIVRTSSAAGVQCGPYRRAVVRHVYVGERRVTRVTCVSAARRRHLVRERVHHRSWKKSAAVIGGSTAAGAGVGALVGGKKGALVGAAAGGAAGTAYEVHKRHQIHGRHRVRRYRS